MILTFFFLLGDGTFSFEEFVQVMANMGGISEQSAEDEEEELRQAFRVFQLFGFGVYIHGQFAYPQPTANSLISAKPG